MAVSFGNPPVQPMSAESPEMRRSWLFFFLLFDDP